MKIINLEQEKSNKDFVKEVLNRSLIKEKEFLDANTNNKNSDLGSFSSLQIKNSSAPDIKKQYKMNCLIRRSNYVA